MGDVNVTVTVNDQPEQPLWARVVATVIVAGLLLWVFGLLWWVLGAVGVCAAAYGWWRLCCWRLGADFAAARRRADIVARADQQNAWFLAGDPRGLYGQYPPAETTKTPPTQGGGLSDWPWYLR